MRAHPFADEYPTMPQADLERMTEDMREHGFDRRFPIVVYKGRILDGRSRAAAAKAAKIKPRTIQFKGTEEQARQFVVTANEHRRHLSAEWLEKKRAERIGRVAEARAKGESLRVIAEEENVSEATVRNDLAEATAQGCAVTPPDGKVTGKDGRQQPATKPDRRCENCIRKFPPGESMKGCEGCKAVRKGRQPGDESARRNGPKVGAAAYDWRPFHDGFGLLLRQVDKAGTLYGAKESGEAERLRALLGEWKVKFKEWFSVVSRTPAPKE